MGTFFNEIAVILLICHSTDDPCILEKVKVTFFPQRKYGKIRYPYSPVRCFIVCISITCIYIDSLLFTNKFKMYKIGYTKTAHDQKLSMLPLNKIITEVI